MISEQSNFIVAMLWLLTTIKGKEFLWRQEDKYVK